MGLGRAGQDMAGKAVECNAGQGREEQAVQCSARQDRAGQDKARHDVRLLVMLDKLFIYLPRFLTTNIM